MKKLMTGIVCLAMAVTAIVARAEQETLGGITWSYSVYEGKAILSSPAIPQDTSGDITIPTSLGGYPVIEISYSAFWNCTQLRSVTIPSQVTSIGSSAFGGCTGLQSVHVPTSVTNIEDAAFQGCRSLSNIAIPYSVRHVGARAFSDVACIDYSTIPGIGLINGWAVESNPDWLPAYVTLNNGVVGLADAVFNGNASLVSVVLGEGVRYIGDEAMAYCYSLASISIPASVLSIGDYAFGQCYGLRTISLASGNRAYVYSGGLLYSADNTVPVLIAASRDAASIVIPEGVNYIEYGFFAGCDSLTSIAIPSTLEEISGDAFCGSIWDDTFMEESLLGCPNLATISVASGNESLMVQNGLLLRKWDYEDYELLLVPPAMTSVIVPEGVTYIEMTAFAFCDKVTTISLPASLSSCDSGCFISCTSLRSFSVAADNPNYSARDGMLFSEGMLGPCLECVPQTMTSVVIPEETVEIAAEAFYGCSGIPSLSIPSNVAKVGSGAFDGCGEGIFDYATIPGCVLVDGWVVGITPDAWSRYGEDGGESWDLNLSGVRGIAVYGFRNGGDEFCCGWRPSLTGLVRVTFSDTLVGIGDYAFKDCPSLTNIVIPSSVRYVGQYAFSALTSLEIKDGARGISDSSFVNCQGLPADTETLPGRKMYDGWVIGWSVSPSQYYNGSITPQELFGWDFDGTLDYTGARGIASRAQCGFGPASCCGLADTRSGMPGVTNLIIGQGVTAIGAQAFQYARDLTNVYIAASVTDIGRAAFLGCVNLKSVQLPDTLRGKIDGSVFAGSSPDLQITYYEAPKPLFLDETGFAGFFTSGGDAEWFEQSDTVYRGNTALQSGKISHNQQSWIETTVSGAGMLSFAWKVSSESVSYDYLEVTVDDVSQGKIGGTDISWTQRNVIIAGDGLHVVRWTYRKDSSVDAGEDCGWLDAVAFEQPPESIRVTFVPNNGGYMAPIDVVPGTTYGELPIPDRSGWMFDGWYLDAGLSQGCDSADPVAFHDQTLYARWSLPVSVFNTAYLSFESFSSSYSGAGTLWSAVENADAQNGLVLKSGNDSGLHLTFTGAGTLRFRGKPASSFWSCSFYKDNSDDSSFTLHPNAWKSFKYDFYENEQHSVSWQTYDNTTLLLGDFTWTPAPEYMTVTLDPNGGTVGEASRMYYPGDTYDMYGYWPLPTPVRSGRTFLGWSVGSALGKTVAESARVPLCDTTLVAKWGQDISAMSVSGLSGPVAYGDGGNRWYVISDGAESFAETELEGMTRVVSYEWGWEGPRPVETTSRLQFTSSQAGYLSFEWSLQNGNWPDIELDANESANDWCGYASARLRIDGETEEFMETWDVDHTTGWAKVTLPVKAGTSIEVMASGWPCGYMVSSNVYDTATDSWTEAYRTVWGDKPAVRVRNITFEPAGSAADFAAWSRRIAQYGSWSVGDISKFAQQYQARINKNPNDYEARILHAATTLAQLGENATFKRYLAQFGYSIDYFGMSLDGETTEPTYWPAVNTLVDAAVSEAVPAMQSALTDLEAIPSSWTGSVCLDADEWPVDEDTYIDIGDVLYARAALEAAVGAAYFAQGYDLTVDYAKAKAASEYRRTLPVLSRAPASVQDMAWDAVLGMGCDENDVGSVKVALYGSTLYARVEGAAGVFATDGGHAIRSLYLNMEGDHGSESWGILLTDSSGGGYERWGNYTARVFVGHENDEWNNWDFSSRIVPVSFTSSGDVCQFAINLSQYPSYSQNGMWAVDWGEVNIYSVYESYTGSYWSHFENDDNDNPPIMYKLLTEQTAFMSQVRNQASLATSKQWMSRALNRALAADAAVLRRTDGNMHFVEYDEADETDLAKARSLTAKALASLDSVQTVDVQNEVLGDREANFDLTLLPDNGIVRVYLGALFEGRITRDLLPEFEQGMDGGPVPVIQTMPDTTLAGLLPDFTRQTWFDILDGAGFPAEWNGEMDDSERYFRALDCEGDAISIATSGTAEWTLDDTGRAPSAGASCLRSGALTAIGSTSVLTLTVSGAGTLEFDWAVSCNATGANVSYATNGVVAETISGTDDVSWRPVTLTFEEDGEHVVAVTYRKASRVNGGSNCAWLDNVRWTPAGDRATVTFDANGGSSSEATRRVAVGAAVGELPSATLAGYRLTGWFTAASGGDQVTPATVVAGDVTYYARWEESATRTVTFDANGGELSGAAVISLDDGATVAWPTVTKDGSSLVGWSDGKRTWATNETCVVDGADIAFVARWASPLAAAADYDGDAVSFAVSGTSEWKLDDTGREPSAGASCLRSGALTAIGSTSELTLTVSGAGTLEFDWAVSCSATGANVSYATNGVVAETISGTDDVSWRPVSLTFEEDGEHVVTMTYKKVSRVNGGSNCAWLDNVRWTPAKSPESELSGAFADASPEEVAKVMAWAEANGKTVADMNAMVFDPNGNPSGTVEAAYLLDCAPTEEAVNKAVAEFEVTSISVDGEGNVVVTPADASDYGNGHVEVRYSATIGGEYTTEKPLGSNCFIKLYLVK